MSDIDADRVLLAAAPAGTMFPSVSSTSSIVVDVVGVVVVVFTFLVIGLTSGMVTFTHVRLSSSRLYCWLQEQK
ncbi:hypothetical protein GH825_30265 [Bacillus thuringiensis]|nr:hypothetical protein [Bacillus thuringiensis]